MEKHILLTILLSTFILFGCTQNQVVDDTLSTPDVTEEVGGISLDLEASSGSILPTMDVAKWETYRNDSCGFEIKLPPTFEQVGQVGDCDDMTYARRNPSIFKFVSQAGCTFPYSNTPGCQLHSFMVANNATVTSGQGVSQEPVTVDGVLGQNTISVGAGAADLVEFNLQVENNGKWYRYLYSFNQNDRTESQQIFNAIVSTFRFL